MKLILVIVVILVIAVVILSVSRRSGPRITTIEHRREKSDESEGGDDA